MLILGIETSCDETAVAVLEVAPRRIRWAHRGEFIEPQAQGKEITVLSSVISSQVKIHAKYGGVVPSLATREHVKNIGHVFNFALKKARINLPASGFKKEIDLIAVTRGPGLGPSLLVGIAFAKTLAWKYDKPLVGVNHLEGHIYSNRLKPVGATYKLANLQAGKLFPILNLIVSGGHTELVLMKGYGKYRIIGETLDDAVGEAFDKVARLLGLSYPGGPEISKVAEKGNPLAYPLPSPMIKSKNYNFSYAGLKTAVLYLVRDLQKNLNLKIKRDVAASFQKAALDVLVYKTIKAAQEYKVKSLFLSGGVSANKELRKRLEKEVKKLKIRYSQPEMEYTGDNAAMIALAGYFSSINKKPQELTWDKVGMDANLGFRKGSM